MRFYTPFTTEEDMADGPIRAPVDNQDGSINSHGMHVIAQMHPRPSACHDDSQLSPLSGAPIASSLSPTSEHSIQFGQPSLVRDRHSMPTMSFENCLSFATAPNDSQSTYPGSPASTYLSVNGRADSPYPSNITFSATNSPVPYGRNGSSDYGSNDYVTPLELDSGIEGNSLCIPFPQTPGVQGGSTARATSCPSLYSGPSAEEPGVNGSAALQAPPTPGSHMYRDFLSPYDMTPSDAPSPNSSVTGSRTGAQSGRSGSQASAGRRRPNSRQIARQEKKVKKNQGKKEKLPCNEEGCTKEFRSTYELRRHVNSFHNGNAKRFICQDPNELLIHTTFQVDRPLSGCRDCENKKEYNAYYNAAAHLRRRHFPAAAKTRAAWAGGDWPPMSELKGRWIVEVQPAGVKRQNVFTNDPLGLSVPELFTNDDVEAGVSIIDEDFNDLSRVWQPTT